MKYSKILIFAKIFLILQAPSAQITSKDNKVVLISIDAAADWILDDLIERKVLDTDGAFARMRAKGAFAKSMLPVGIPVTAVSHTTLYTGTLPGINGIVGSQFLMARDTIKAPRASSGFKAKVKSETLWRALIRQGRTVVNINTVGQDNADRSRKGHRTIAYGTTVAKSFVNVLKPDISYIKYPMASFERVAFLQPQRQSSFRLGNGSKIPIYCYAVDTTKDGIINYDRVMVDLNKDLNDGHAGLLNANEWAPIEVNVDGQKMVSWSYLKELNSITAEASAYFGSIGYNAISPVSYKQQVENNIGLWPGEQDNGKLRTGLISEQMYFDQLEREAKYYQQLLLAEMNTGDWDVLSGYFNLIDDVAHFFTLKSNRQLDYKAENGARAKRYDQYLEWAYKTIDILLKQLMDMAPKDVNFIIVSDHGIAPVHSVVLVNNLLKQNGIEVSGEHLEARAYGTGPTAQVYVNVKGRQGNGTVVQEDLPEYEKRIAKIFKEVVDSVTGKPVFPVIMTSGEMKRSKLAYKGRSGDVFVSARSGWSVSSKLLPELPIIVPNSFNKDSYAHLDKNVQDFLSGGFMNETGLGVHGNYGNGKEMQAVFYAIGPNIPNVELGSISSLDVTPTVAALLKCDPPSMAKGNNVFRKYMK